MAESIRDFEKAGIKVVAISVDAIEDSVTFANKLSITFPLLFDEGLKAALAYGVAMDGDEIAVPSVFIVNTRRQIVFEYVGESVVDRPGVGRLLEEAKKAK